MSGVVGAIVLAAGSSRRFGADKREARLPGGATLLGQAVERLLPAVDEVLLVLRADDDEARFHALFPACRLLRARRSAEGMGASLADAIGACSGWDGALVALADKPFVRTATVLRVRQALHRAGLVVPCHRGEWGHPVGFGHAYFPALARLRGDAGARALIEAHRDTCVFLETGDPGVLLDVDTPEALRQAGG